MVKKSGWRTKSLLKQLKGFKNNPKMMSRIQGRIDGLKGK